MSYASTWGTTPSGYKPMAGQNLKWGHPLTQGLVFCAALVEGSGWPYDLVRRQRGTLTGATWRVGKDLVFVDASTNNVDFGSIAPYLPTKAFSATIEFYISALPAATRSLFANRATPNGGGFGMYILSTGKIQFSLYTSSDTNVALLSDLSVTANTWYQATLTWDGVTLREYLTSSGQTSTNSLAGSGAVGITAGNTLRIGSDKDSNSRAHSGYIRRALLHNRALSPTEVKLLHNDPYCFWQPIFPSQSRWVAVAASRRRIINWS